MFAYVCPYKLAHPSGATQLSAQRKCAAQQAFRKASGCSLAQESKNPFEGFGRHLRLALKLECKA